MFDGRSRQGPLLVEGEDGVTRRLPEERKGPLVATRRKEQADSND